MRPSPTPAILVAAGDLRPALAALSKVIPRQGARQVMEHILAEPVDNQTLRLTAAGQALFLSIDIRARNLEHGGPFLLSLPRLQGMIKATRGPAPITIEPGPPPGDRFPAMPRFRSTPVSLEPAVVKAIHRALSCASSDPARLIINGALLEPRGRSLQVTGTDGKHLFTAGPFEVTGLGSSLVLPAHKVWKSPLLKEAGQPWSLRVTDDSPEGNWFRIDGQGWSLTGKPLEGSYPDCQRVIPEPSRFRSGVVIPDRRLPELVKLLAPLPRARAGQPSVCLSLEKKGLVLLVREHPDKPHRPVPVEGAASRGAPVTVHLDPDYLAKALAWGLNRIEVIDGASPVKFHRDNGLMVIMPVRVPGDVQVRQPGQRSPERGQESRTGPRPAKTETAVEGTRVKPPVAGRPKPVKPTPADDPIGIAAKQLTEARAALKSAEATLRAARQQNRESERRMRMVRGTLRHLWDIGL